MSTSSRQLDANSVVGKGLTSDVYAWEEGRVLKLFHAGVPRAKVEREHRITRAVHATGLPVPAVYDLLEVDGRCGILFERVEGVSLFQQVQARPWTLLAAVRQLAELHAQMHACHAPLGLPSQREWLTSRIYAAQGLTDSEKDHARRCLAALPDGGAICHGDFHPDNIIVTARGPVIIDWDTATRGHPLGDVACTSRLIQKASLPAWAPLHTQLMLRIFRALIHRTYLNRYLHLHPGSRDEIDAWHVPLAAASR